MLIRAGEGTRVPKWQECPYHMLVLGGVFSLVAGEKAGDVKERNCNE